MTGTMENGSTPILELCDIGMQFGGITALKGLNFAVYPGIIQAVIGPNGAGKTTLFHCISGIHQPTSGRIFFEGRQINGQPPHRIAASGISRTFQHVALFKSMTVLENIMVGRHCRTRNGFWATGLRFPGMRAEEERIREKALSHLEFVGLNDEAHLQAGTLPLGKQKILEIARALATDPRLVLLDEPAGGLNMRETEELGELIQRICQGGITVILVEHDMNLVMEISDMILVLHYGGFLAAGSPKEIKDRPEVIEAYLGNE
ncbi:MAG TPA: ABC transporter ATP-binding protein [Syntrophobacteraceae bacterium]|nr:ABC transporter ATP-binding protein [Syntrophobacteraceae bacterium]